LLLREDVFRSTAKVKQTLPGPEAVDDDAKNDDSDDDESVALKKKRTKREKRFSEFVYNSKLDALVSELMSVREEDPNGVLVCCSCPS